MAKKPGFQRPLAIGELARRSGCSVPTLRYYESIGLLPAAERLANGYRSYGDAALQEVNLIRALRASGLSLKQVQLFLKARKDRDALCTSIAELARQRAASIRRSIQLLRLQEERLLNFAQSCDRSCAGGLANSCSALQSLQA